MKQLCIHIIGHNASGKTTIAKKLEQTFGFSRISGDDFRNFLREHISYLKTWDTSHPTHIGRQLRPLTTNYRLELVRILLQAGQSVIIDGSGFTKADRQPIQTILRDYPAVTKVTIYTTLPEAELLGRLQARGAHWTEMYHDVRKPGHEPPEAHETDILLEYNQHNYADIEQKIRELLELKDY